MSKKKDITFLKAHLGFLQLEYEAILYRVSPKDMYSEDNIPDSETPGVFERAARLAGQYGFDSSTFRNLIPGPPQDFEEFTKNFEGWKKEQAEKIKKQIDTIPKIVEKIEKSDKAEQGWKIENGQVFYNGIDLQFPSGHIQDVLQKLVESDGKTVLNDELEEVATGKHRHHISKIRKCLKSKNVPYEIKTVTYEGYKLQKK
jgi:hypothetical protein